MSGHRIVLTLLLALAGLAGQASVAQALSFPPPLAKLVFSNGGRILTMNADGTGREVLFGKNRNPRNDDLGAVEPAASRDGETIVFAFKRRHRLHELFDIWTVGADGTGARRILKSTPGLQYGDPTFMPNGRLMVAFYRQNKTVTKTGLISIGTGGGNRFTEYRLSQRRRPYLAPKLVMEPDVDATGKRVLFVMNDGFGGVSFDEGFENDLMVLNLETGKTRKVAEDAFEAAWSPNGKLIAYSRQTEDSDLETCWWESGCDFEGALAVVKADGSSGWVVNGKGLDERSPDWSRDNRIVFHSARNLPGTGEASEIWSVRPNGRCLTPLTNGSPASLTPAWAGVGPAEIDHPACGELPNDSEVEIRLPGGLDSRPETLWLGERPDHRLLSGADYSSGVSQFLYYDCDRQLGRDCRQPVGQWTADVCTYRGQIAGIFSESPTVRRQRGTMVFIGDRTEIGRFVSLFAGRSVVFFFGGSGKGRQFGAAEVAQLRRIDQEAPAGKLSAPAFPARDIKLMKEIAGIYKATGSVPKTARRAGLRARTVRANLRFSRALKAYDGYETVNCPAAPR